jgi:hypothetical protein
VNENRLKVKSDLRVSMSSEEVTMSAKKRGRSVGRQSRELAYGFNAIVTLERHAR